MGHIWYLKNGDHISWKILILPSLYFGFGSKVDQLQFMTKANAEKVAEAGKLKQTDFGDLHIGEGIKNLKVNVKLDVKHPLPVGFFRSINASHMTWVQFKYDRFLLYM